MDVIQLPQALQQLEATRQLPPGLLNSMMQVESGGNSDTVSPKGAQGAFQFMPSTAAAYGVNVHDPIDSARGAADYMQDLIAHYGGNVNAALAHYNGGFANGRAVVNGGAPVSKETQGYLSKVNAGMQQAPQTAPDQAPQVPDMSDFVAKAVLDGQNPQAILMQLGQHPAAAAAIDAGTKNGYTPEEMVSAFGGQKLQDIKAAQAKIDQQGIGTNFAQQAGHDVADLGEAAKQLGYRATGNDAALKASQDKVAHDQADPERQALGKTWGAFGADATVGSLPYVAAGAVAPEGVLGALAANGVAGLAQGALTPTSGSGQIGPNMLTAGALGAAVGGGGKLLGDAVPGLVTANPEKLAKFDQLMADAKAQNLPVQMRNVMPMLGHIANGMPDNSIIAGSNQAMEDAVAKEVAARAGVPNWDGGIDHNLVNKAKDNIDNMYKQSVGSIGDVPVPKDLVDQITEAVKERQAQVGAPNLHPTLARLGTSLNEAAGEGRLLNGDALQSIRSQLGSVLSDRASAPEDRAAAFKILDGNGPDAKGLNQIIQDHITAAGKDPSTFTAANNAYRHLLAVKDIVSRSFDNNTPVTAKTVLSAAKSGSLKPAFLTGTAPYQDLGNALGSLTGSAKGNALGDLMAGAVKHGVEEAAHPVMLVESPHLWAGAMLAKHGGEYGASKLATLDATAHPNLAQWLAAPGFRPKAAQVASKAIDGLGDVGAGTPPTSPPPSGPVGGGPASKESVAALSKAIVDNTPNGSNANVEAKAKLKALSKALGDHPVTDAEVAADTHIHAPAKVDANVDAPIPQGWKDLPVDETAPVHEGATDATHYGDLSPLSETQLRQLGTKELNHRMALGQSYQKEVEAMDGHVMSANEANDRIKADTAKGIENEATYWKTTRQGWGKPEVIQKLKDERAIIKDELGKRSQAAVGHAQAQAISQALSKMSSVSEDARQLELKPEHKAIVEELKRRAKK